MGQAFNAFKLLESGYIVPPFLFGVDLASTLLHEDQALFGAFIPPRATNLYDAARRCNQPALAQSGRVETVNFEFKSGLISL
jgi:hypothetical protein